MTVKIHYLKPVTGIATKTFKYDEKNERWVLDKGYKAGKYFDGYSYPVSSLAGAFEVIEKYQTYPMFMIQGEFIPGINLKNIVRIKRADRGEEPTIQDRELTLICFDVDGYKCDQVGKDAIEMFIQELPAPFWEADYIYQFSASYGLTSTALKAHIFFWLEQPVDINAIRAWTISYNEEKGWKNVLDPAVFVATQPVYTQRRICSGRPDPIAEFVGLIQKSGNLEWTPPKNVPAAPQSKNNDRLRSEYSMSESIRRILTAESFHEEINRLALSLMGKGLPSQDIKETIRGLMQAAKVNTKDLKIWQDRYNDIDRSVDSAFNLVDNPAQEDLLAWLKVAPKDRVLKEFPTKTFRKTPEELAEIIEVVHSRTGIGKRDLKKRVKGFQEKSEKQSSLQGRKNLLNERKKHNVFEVVVNEHNHAAASKQCGAILSKSQRWPPVFAYGPGLAYIDFGRLVTIRQMSKHAKMKKAGQKYCKIPTIKPFRKPFHDLIARLGQDIRFVNKPLGKEILCPEKLASVVALGEGEQYRELTGIVHSPFIREDWTIFEQKGYDSSTGLYSVIEQPLRRPFQYADDAYKYLKNEVLAEFPFKSELDAVTMIASMMALMQRPLLAQDPAGMPGFGITAPVQASGKTTLVNLATTAVLKQSAPASSFSSDEEELGKHILSLLREGRNCVLFDNIKHSTEVKSDELATAMSSEIYSNRLLGENRTISVASSVIWYFTGNNIQFSGDFATRVYPIFLNPKMENPDTRRFSRENILDWTLAERGNILWALASIILAGQNAPAPPEGSRFKIWDRFIRSPLLAATGFDINDSISINKENDLDFVNKKRLVAAIYEQFKESPATSRQIIDAGFYEGSGKTSGALGEILEEILGKYSQNTKSVGRLLSKMVSRNYGNLVLTRVDLDRAFWQVEESDVEK